MIKSPFLKYFVLKLLLSLFLKVVKIICVKNTLLLFRINLNVIFAEYLKMYTPKLPIQLQVVVY